MNPSNSNINCTIDESSKCISCEIEGKLACKWDKSIKDCFAVIGFAPILIAIFGMVIIGLSTGIWWTLVAYVAYFMLMFGVFEIRFLCSHCPYYVKDGKTLICIGNHGSPKLWNYHPEPMNKFEKFMMSFGVITMIFFIIPSLILGYGIWHFSVNLETYGLMALLGIIGITFATLFTSTVFVTVMKTFFCPKCVNFSCPLNTVPKKVMDDYLKKNPVMKGAWEKSGYVIES
jgi:hypothetical protein